jgi:hypothetical protein
LLNIEPLPFGFVSTEDCELLYFLFRQVATNTYLRPASTGVYVTPT